MSVTDGYGRFSLDQYVLYQTANTVVPGYFADVAAHVLHLERLAAGLNFLLLADLAIMTCVAVQGIVTERPEST